MEPMDTRPTTPSPETPADPPTFQDVIMNLQRFWADTGCIVLEPYDTEVGAGTNAPATTLRALGPQTWRTAYVQGCRRPTDGRYGENPNRLQFYYQFQVLIKPSPADIQDLYLQSLQAIGIDVYAHDVRFVEDDWESPTLGAWGLGWEVWIDGMEVTQFTYFQQVGGFECAPVPVEIAYGLERLTMFVQGVDSVYDIVWSRGADGIVFTYGDVYLENEREFSRYNFETADTDMLFELFASYERECQATLAAHLPLPAYDYVLKCSHTFNLLDARGVISATERMAYILRVRDLAKACCEAYLETLRAGEPTSAPAPEIPATLAPNADAPAEATLAFEIGTEEIPAFDLVRATDQLRTLVPEALDAARIPHGAVAVYSTPRRLIAIVEGVRAETEAVEEVFRGPKVEIAYDAEGAPTKAAIGFARGKGLAVEELTQQDEDGVAYVYATRTLEALDVRELLPDALRSIIDGISWPKSCRWGTTKEWFSRPVRWICALWGDEVIPLTYAGLVAGRTTRAHRFLAPGEHEIARADDLLDVLRANYVVPSFEEREQIIRAGVQAAEAEYDAIAELPEKTLVEVVNLSEYPTVLVGTFDETFLAVPQEIIVDAMLMHQRYFPLYDESHGLNNRFIVVSNGDPERGALIIDGNERVVAARLYDAKFFYEEDLKAPLADYVDRLDELVFQKDLGTMKAKTARVRQLAEAMATAAALDESTTASVVRAAELAKADLVTNAVIEFTSVQGIMGSYYATASGEPPIVAEAIADHYRPRFAGDELPCTDVAKIVAVADKIDTICALFAVGQPPTSTKDPFGLRRSALGVIAILESGLEVSLVASVDRALAILAENGVPFDRAAIRDAILEFFIVRTRVLLRDGGVEADTVEAVLGVDIAEPSEIIARSRALQEARTSDRETVQDLATAFARANNLRDATLGVDFDETLFMPVEQTLADAIAAADDAVKEALGDDDYGTALVRLAALRSPIDRFFDDVMVMDEDPALRANRLKLLNRFVDVFANVADFGRMVAK